MSLSAKRIYQAVLKHLHSPYVDTVPGNHKDAFYSSVFWYWLIDMLTHHKQISQVMTSKKCTMVPISSHLVCLIV